MTFTNGGFFDKYSILYFCFNMIKYQTVNYIYTSDWYKTVTKQITSFCWQDWAWLLNPALSVSEPVAAKLLSA